MNRWLTKTLLIGIASGSAALTTAEASIEGATSTERAIISYSEISTETTTNQFLKRNPRVILECSEGTLLPLHFSISGDFLTSAGEDISLFLCLKETCYMKWGSEAALFSRDLQEWKEFHEFFTGQAAVAVNIDEEGTPLIRLSLELNLRT